MGEKVKSPVGIMDLNSVAKKLYTWQKNTAVALSTPPPLFYVHDFIYTLYIYKANCKHFHIILFTMFKLKNDY